MLNPRDVGEKKSDHFDYRKLITTRVLKITQYSNEWWHNIVIQFYKLIFTL